MPAKDRTVNRSLRALNTGIYSVLGLVAFVCLAPWMKGWWMVLREPVTWHPHLPPLWAVGLAVAAVGGGLFAVLGRTLSGEKPLRPVVVGFLGVTVVLVVLRLQGAPPIPLVSAHEPVERTADAMKRVGAVLARYYLDEGRYPAASSVLEDALPDGGPGWRSHGRALPFRIVGQEGWAARLVGAEGDLPGTLYYVVAPGGQRFWLTALVMEGAPAGRVAFLRDGEGKPLVLSRGSPREAGALR